MVLPDGMCLGASFLMEGKMTCTNPEFSTGEGTPDLWKVEGGGGSHDSSLTPLEEEAVPRDSLHKPQHQACQVEFHPLSDTAPAASDTSEDDSWRQVCLWVERKTALIIA